MKHFFLAAVSSFFLFACTGNNSNARSESGASQNTVSQSQASESIMDSSRYTTLQWLDSAHQDLGKVREGAELEVVWRFKNTGSKPLIISNASASCGCTVAEKPEAPIAPGEEGRIKAKFDSKGREGTQVKEVYVIANTSVSTDHKLSFAVDVQKN